MQGAANSRRSCFIIQPDTCPKRFYTMKKLIFLFLLLSSLIFFAGCEDEEDIVLVPDYEAVQNPNPVSDAATIEGNWVIRDYQEDDLDDEDLVYIGLNLSFDGQGNVFLSGGAISSQGTWFLDGTELEITGLGDINDDSNELNEEWDTDMPNSTTLQIYDNSDQEKFVLEKL